MTLAAAVGLIMILIFIIGVMKRWLSPYVGLAVVPLAAGIIFCLITGQNVLDVFEWVYSGVFYAVEDGEVSAGTVRSAMMVLFACTYFTLPAGRAADEMHFHGCHAGLRAWLHICNGTWTDLPDGNRPQR